jgi:hyperosmotically inducible periplasmic protein
MKYAFVVGLLAVLVTTGLAGAEAYPPNNSGKNARDADGRTLTSGDQSNSKEDVRLTQEIRKAVVGDKALSMSAHNAKIITVGGEVTLRGPVQTAAEKTKVGEIATQVAGVGHVHNNLEVASH